MLRRPRTEEGLVYPTFEVLESRLLLAGDVVISEFMAINENTLKAADGSDPDWIEIHNPTASPINLSGYALTDDDGEHAGPREVWLFPDMTLQAGAYRYIFASGVSQTDPSGELHCDFALDGGGEYLALLGPTGEPVHEYAPEYPKQLEDVSYGLGDATVIADTLLSEGVSLKVLIPTDDSLGTTWTGGSEPFDDSTWIIGDTSVGYDLGTEYEGLIETNLESVMYGQGTSAYVRFFFSVPNASALTSLTLRMRYDDAFVAYLNGVPVALDNVLSPIAYDSTAEEDRPDSQAKLFRDFDVSAYLGALQDGENILAVHGVNLTSGDDDLLIMPELLADVEIRGEEVYFTTPTPGAPNVSGTAGIVADTSFSVDRGFFDEEFELAITSNTPGAEMAACRPPPPGRSTTARSPSTRPRCCAPRPTSRAIFPPTSIRRPTSSSTTC